MIAVTSKIVSLAEDRVVARDSIQKTDLVIRESDVYLGEVGYGCHLTVKHGLLIPSAGIDESNSESGDYILYPIDPWGSARRLYDVLSARWGITRLGVILTDSHTTPLRRGVTGVALAYFGIRGVRSFVGHPDIFGRSLEMTSVNRADALAAAAVLVMGEADEQSPLAIIEDAQVEFDVRGDRGEVQIPLDEDLYGPVLKPAFRS